MCVVGKNECFQEICDILSHTVVPFARRSKIFYYDYLGIVNCFLYHTYVFPFDCFVHHGYKLDNIN